MEKNDFKRIYLTGKQIRCWIFNNDYPDLRSMAKTSKLDIQMCIAWIVKEHFAKKREEKQEN